jgi:prevent-host-death family protein
LTAVFLKYTVTGVHLEVEMKTVTARELRAKTSEILQETRKGNEVLITLRGKPAAILKPLENREERGFKRIGFGLWRDRDDMKDPCGWVEERRSERKGSTGSL